MATHELTVAWSRGEQDFNYETYSRNHDWIVPGGMTVPASSAPGYHGDATRMDPEQAFVASISSCHMLWFLHLACDRKWVVDSYKDEAVGTLEKCEDDNMRITCVQLKPRVTFNNDTPVTDEQLQSLHQAAHGNCFIAHSVTSEVIVTPQL